MFCYSFYLCPKCNDEEHVAMVSADELQYFLSHNNDMINRLQLHMQKIVTIWAPQDRNSRTWYVRMKMLEEGNQHLMCFINYQC